MAFRCVPAQFKQWTMRLAAVSGCVKGAQRMRKIRCPSYRRYRIDAAVQPVSPLPESVNKYGCYHGQMQ